MRDFIIALILSALLVGCTTLTRIKYETPEKQFELEHSRDSLAPVTETEVREYFEAIEEL